jgi:hypothetical protein
MKSVQSSRGSICEGLPYIPLSLVALFFGVLTVGIGPAFATTSAFFPTTDVAIPDFDGLLLLFGGGSSSGPFDDDRPRFTIWGTFLAAISATEAQGFRFFVPMAFVAFFALTRVVCTKAFE